jgi:hypothetical protein
MLAANRKDNVIGRTIILIVSIRTRKGFNQSGAPPGKSLPINFIGLYIILERIIENHKTRPKTKVKIRWLVILNLYGSSP